MFCTQQSGAAPLQASRSRYPPAACTEELKQIPAAAFQAVDESCLMVSPNSGQAYQPGSAGYLQHCG